MGQSAMIPIMIATTIASTAAGVYSSQRSAAIAAEDARARGRQAAMQAKEEEINRLDIFSQVASENLARMSAGGLAQEGTLAQITQGNISSLEEDVQGIKASGAAQQSYYNRAASNASSQGRVNTFATLLQGASQLSSINYSVNQTAIPSDTATGSVTGVTG